MKIAQIAPPWFSVPPKNYGGTEAVIYNLVEKQVELGHDVTLYASGNSRTSAKLVSFIPLALMESGVPWQAHLKAYYHLQKAVNAVKQGNFDIVHVHLSSASDMYLFPLMAGMQVPHVMTLHSRFPFDRLPNGWIGDADALYMEWASSMPMVAISEHAREEVSYPLDFVGVVYHGLLMNQFSPVRTLRRGYFAWLGRCVPDKGAHLAIQAAKEAGVPLDSRGNSRPQYARIGTLLSRADQATYRQSANPLYWPREYEGEDQSFQRCARLPQPYRVGGAVWHGDDRGDGGGLSGHLL